MATQSFTSWKQAPYLAAILFASSSCAIRFFSKESSTKSSGRKFLETELNENAESPYESQPGYIRKKCVERTVGDPYCEASCQNFRYGELPNLHIGRKLGEGAFGEVRLAVADNSKEVIIKLPKNGPGSIQSDEQEKTLYNEAMQYSHLRGIPGIVDLIYAGPLPQRHVEMVVIIEKLEMNFFDYMQYWKRPEHPQEHRWPRFGDLATVGRELLKILKHVHKRRYLHRDIKAENLMFKDGMLYLIDLGATCPIGKDVCNVHGSPFTVSTDVWNGFEQTVRDDLISVVYLLVHSSGQHTWDECLDVSRYNAIRGPRGEWKENPQPYFIACLNEKKLQYLEKPTTCGVTGLDKLTEMVQRFNPASGEDFDYDAGIALLSDHSSLMFPGQNPADAERHAKVLSLNSVSAFDSSAFSADESLSLEIIEHQSFGDLQPEFMQQDWAGVYDDSDGGTAKIQQPGVMGRPTNLSLYLSEDEGTRLDATVEGDSIKVYQKVKGDGNPTFIPLWQGKRSNGVIEWPEHRTWTKRETKSTPDDASEQLQFNAQLKSVSEATAEQVEEILSKTFKRAEEPDAIAQLELATRDHSHKANVHDRVLLVFDGILSPILFEKGFKDMHVEEFLRDVDFLAQENPKFKQYAEKVRMIAIGDLSVLKAASCAKRS